MGAGVQSSTLALMAAKSEITPMPDFAVFADTQAEPESVYRWLDWLEQQLPFPVYRVTRGNLAEDGLEIRTSGNTGKTYLRTLIPLFTRPRETKQPVLNWGLNKNELNEFELERAGKRGKLWRKCTRDYKIEAIERFVKKELNIGRGEKQIKAIQWIGISTDEAVRIKQSETAWSEFRHPLIEVNMSRQDCLDWMEKNHYPQPPRSACVFCPYHSDAEWLRMKAEEPFEFAKAVKWEKDCQTAALNQEALQDMPFLHDSCKPLDEVEFDATKGKYRFSNECVGICGV